MTDRDCKPEILNALAELIHHVPGQRFGQLIANLAVIARGPEAEAVWDVEDPELLAAVRSHLADWDRRPVAVSE